MEVWLNDNFPAYNGGIIVYQDTQRETICDPILLSNQLGTTVPPTHAGLSTLALAAQNWQSIFDQWKADGKIV